jgi:hypothetical protein
MESCVLVGEINRCRPLITYRITIIIVIGILIPNGEVGVATMQIKKKLPVHMLQNRPLTPDSACVRLAAKTLRKGPCINAVPAMR